jgi:protein-tyrosine phosphatase
MAGVLNGESHAVLAGVPNFRDYGGYVCSGGRLKQGLLFRSAEQSAATIEDLSYMAGLGISDIVDLRGGDERAAAPCRRPAGFSARVHCVDDSTAGLAPHIEAARTVARRAPTADQACAAMIRGYREMPYRVYLRIMLRRYFTILAESAGASLIHCMAGKDRTGLAVALFHTLAGVHKDDLFADYLASNLASNLGNEQRILARTELMRRSFGADLDADAAYALLSVRFEYLDAAFEAICERSGSLERYLTDELGLGAAQRDQLLRAYVQ